MIALDTNVLVRFLVESTDEPTQSAGARALVADALASGHEVLLPPAGSLARVHPRVVSSVATRSAVPVASRAVA